MRNSRAALLTLLTVLGWVMARIQETDERLPSAAACHAARPLQAVTSPGASGAGRPTGEPRVPGTTLGPFWPEFMPGFQEPWQPFTGGLAARLPAPVESNPGGRALSMDAPSAMIPGPEPAESCSQEPVGCFPVRCAQGPYLSWRVVPKGSAERHAPRFRLYCTSETAAETYTARVGGIRMRLKEERVRNEYASFKRAWKSEAADRLARGFAAACVRPVSSLAVGAREAIVRDGWSDRFTWEELRAELQLARCRRRLARAKVDGAHLVPCRFSQGVAAERNRMQGALMSPPGIDEISCPNAGVTPLRANFWPWAFLKATWEPRTIFGHVGRFGKLAVLRDILDSAVRTARSAGRINGGTGDSATR